MASEIGNSSPKSPAEQSTLESASLAGLPPLVIGGYRILRALGAGGMGVVYEAEQQNPKRLVALKVIQGGRYVDEHQIKLFEREAQALARLKHPGIAAIYESGRTTDGQHFFAMELVRGETLEAYLQKSKGRAITHAELRERLVIFRRIAEAVSYAHQRGVIHRDLKPSNVIIQREVVSADADTGTLVPAIKVLDFGLARITETDIAAVTVNSEIGRIQGTLPYMSPEQVRGNPDEIDLRTDVYSLGVILYEMLSGRNPYDVHKVMLHEAVRVICEVPPTPLTKTWSGSGHLDKDLETIVAKALEKQTALRYQSVSGFGDDVTRFLTRQPILARPHSAMYQLRKLVARHKLGFAVAVILILLLAAFAAIMSVQAERIAQERDRANREAHVAQQVSDFLVGLFAVADPEGKGGKDTPVVEILDRGARRIEFELQEQPEVNATLMDTMGKVYRNLGMYDRATELVEAGLHKREKILGPDAPEVAASLNALGVLRMDKGDFGPAEKLIGQGLDIRRKRFGPESLEVAESLVDLAALRFYSGDWKAAEQTFREALAINRKLLSSDDVRLATTLNDLGLVLRNEEKFPEAEQLYRESMEIRRKALGNQHPLVAQSLNNLAMAYLRQRKYAEAEPMFEEALAINRKSLGEYHPDVASNLSNLGLLNLEQCRTGLLKPALQQQLLRKAEGYYREVLELDRKNYGENHPYVAESLQNLGLVLTREKRFPEAEQYLRQALAIKLSRFPEDHWQVATTKGLLGQCLADAGNYNMAEPLLLTSYGIINKQFGIQHSRTRRAAEGLISLYERTGRNDKAAALRAELGTGQ